MSSRKSLKIRLWLQPPAAFLLLMALGGCVDYLERRDTITLAAGDAQNWNKVVHIADPWPPYAGNTNIPGDGQRTAGVIRRYSTGGGNVGSAGAGVAEGAGGASDPSQ
jgi:hypothetical protein